MGPEPFTVKIYTGDSTVEVFRKHFQSEIDEEELEEALEEYGNNWLEYFADNIDCVGLIYIQELGENELEEGITFQFVQTT